MVKNRNKLYWILFIACLTGYIWFYLSYKASNSTHQNNVGRCLIKYVTDIPCPSCGTTRAIILLSKGNFIETLYLNPMGYLVALIMIVAPVWICVDVLTRRSSLFAFYQKIEHYLKQPKYAIPLVVLVILNWIWNIIKGV